MSRTQRAVFGAVAIVIAVVAIILVAGGSSEKTTTQAAGGAKTVHVVGGKPDGGIQVVAWSKGDQVRLNVESDTADQVHIHGYGLRAPVQRGEAARFSFPAKLEGEFIVELERTKTQIAALRVRP